jgi:hypothetical protein
VQVLSDVTPVVGMKVVIIKDLPSSSNPARILTANLEAVISELDGAGSGNVVLEYDKCRPWVC